MENMDYNPEAETALQSAPSKPQMTKDEIIEDIVANRPKYERKIQDREKSAVSIHDSEQMAQKHKNAVQREDQKLPPVSSSGRLGAVGQSSSTTVGRRKRGGSGKPRTRKRTRPSIIIHRHKTRRIAPKSVSLDKKYTRRNKNHKQTERSKTE